MKILVISTGRFGMDGITNVILNYYRAIDKKEIHFDFVIPNKVGEEIKFEFEKNGSSIFQITGRMKNPWSYIKNLTKLMKEYEYDIIHAHGNSCTLALETYAAKKAGIKVRIPHSHNSTNKYKGTHKILRKLFDSTYTHGFACGKLAGEWLYNGKPYEIINNAIVVERFEYNPEIREVFRRKYGLDAQKVIGHIGSLTYQKNHDFLLDIFEKLYQLDSCYRLMIIGDGELKKDVKEKAERLGLSKVITFTGNTLEVPELMQVMDLLILPSRFEGLPLTLIEAQAASLPCFVSDNVSNEAAITNLIKFISLEKKPDEWAKFINSQEPVDRKTVSENINKEITNAGYSISRNAERVSVLYKSFLEQVKE